jgi:hypothetical protein
MRLRNLAILVLVITVLVLYQLFAAKHVPAPVHP